MHFGSLSIFQNYRNEQSDSDIVQGELALAKLAEDAGFDSFWAVEHHFFPYSMCPDNFQFLAQVAGMTKRIKLGTGAVIMPWNHPYRVAVKAALLDSQSGGRALLGFGRGLSRREYAAMNVAMDEARGRFDQGTELVLQALEKGFFEADTEFYSHPRCELRPRPTRGFADRVFYRANMNVTGPRHEQITIGQCRRPADIESQNIFADFFIGCARGNARESECVNFNHKEAPICLFRSRR